MSNNQNAYVCALSYLVDKKHELADLQRRYDQLAATFEELVVQQFAISELRDFWRVRAGLPVKGEEE